MDENTYRIFQITLQFLGVITAIFIFVLAIWGDKIKYYLGFRPKLILEVNNPMKVLTTSKENGVKIWIWQLIVKNKNSKWAVAEKVQLLILEIKKIYPNGKEERQYLSGALQINWQYHHLVNREPDMGQAKICDFGGLIEGRDRFEIFVYQEYKEFIGHVKKDELIEVILQVDSMHTQSKKYKIVVNWDGNWSDNIKSIGKHLSVNMSILK
jgi:hypothetical protein